MFIRFMRKQDKPDFHELPDHELILKYRVNADPEIIALLFQRYAHLVYGVCLKYLNDKDGAKDAVMEIFEGLMEDILRHEIRNFKSWLHSVTRNHCLMMLRKAKPVRMEMAEEKNDGVFMEIPGELHQEVELEEYTLKELESAMVTLKEPQRRCIELVYLMDKSYMEVCDITGYSINEVKSHVQNGKRNLKIRLESRNVGKI
ncbi:MAG: sigma-70 family RNA polymerase sigma factor [Bacteroidales bacterium]|nr:sigma-70 family RNA polymerase sigma factor [Bacteroidales bacterium]